MYVPLSETSSFVLVCDGGINYPNKKAKEFLSHLDLSKGRKMSDKVRHLQPYINESIRNRKFIIHNFIRQKLKSGYKQVLFLACGWDPVLIQLSSEFPNLSFFGVDSESVDLQKKLAQKILPRASIFYHRANITDPKILIKQLLKKGWRRDCPSGLIIEGITYYIPPKKFWESLKILKQNILPNAFICGDFLVDGGRQKISKIYQDLSLELFDMIQKTCRQDYYSYTTKQIQKCLEALDFSSIQFFTQDELQKKRTGRPKPWGKNDGHLQIFTAISH